ncbi:hypothetical protein WICPIJ_005787 [Wickerhamomyces pijperi]|uniref:Uncharacterized protein n=1 Tax=Wickerhamomyces pijperi TaxID=599730 RepID=A0A9P8Q5J3_WICPI|nr:hypothetical protein WICPIJ_005787 [Wickerhamomyces pijperi]
MWLFVPVDGESKYDDAAVGFVVVADGIGSGAVVKAGNVENVEAVEVGEGMVAEGSKSLLTLAVVLLFLAAVGSGACLGCY